MADANDAVRDGNHVPSILFKGSDDLSYPVEGDEATGRMKVDASGIAFGITIGSTTITGGTTTRILYDNAGVVGEYTISGSGTQVAMATAPTFGTSITGSYLTASTILIADGSKNIISADTATYPSLTELSYVKGVTSAIQAQLNAKQATITFGTGVETALGVNVGTAGSIVVNGGVLGTPSSGTLTNATGLPIVAGTTGTLSVARGGTGVTTIAGLSIWVANSADTITSVTPAAGQSIRINGAGNAWEAFTPSSSVPTTITVADEATDTSCFLAFFTAATGDLGPKTNTNMTFNSNTGVATFASTVLTTTDINGGTIDGVTIGGASAGAITGTTITANTGFMPDANDGAYLGQSGTAFSDLYLASGALIDFAAGNAVITHSSGILTVSTGDLRVTTAGTNTASVVTVGGTQTLTSKTLTSPTINTATLGGTSIFAEGGAIAYDAASSADGVYTGFVRAGTAGATLAFGDLVYLAAADSRWELADADAATTADRFLGMCVLAAAADGDPTTILLMGFIRADAAFPALTIGSPVYVGETAGDIQTSIPTGADNVIRRVGYAWTADELYFNPSMDSQTTVA